MTSDAGASELREHFYARKVLTIPEIILIVGTRVALGVGGVLLVFAGIVVRDPSGKQETDSSN